MAVLASGPSMSREAADQFREVPCIVVNSTFRLAPWAWMLYAADRQWWAHPDNRDAMQFAGIKATCEEPIKGVELLRQTGVTGFDPTPGCIRTGGNSGHQALHIAAQTGASRILLAGFDMKGRTHWHDEHAAPLRNTEPEHYPLWIQRFEVIAARLAKRGIDVVNVTPGSALKAFRMSTIEEEIACVAQ